MAPFSQRLEPPQNPGRFKHNLAAGFGSLGYEPNVDYFFGFPRAITTGGVGVNVWVADVHADTEGNTEHRRNFQRQIGMLSSALEHSVPELMFNTPSQPAQGVSAVKALQIAAAQGQRIYHITSANQAQALPNLQLDNLAMEEITSALAAGREVIAHTDRISVAGWTGEGYILFDSVTGAGAYKITGGGNGGFLKILNELQARLTQFLSAHSNTIIAALIGISLTLVSAMIAILAGGFTVLSGALISLIWLMSVGSLIALDADPLAIALVRLWTVAFIVVLYAPLLATTAPMVLGTMMLLSVIAAFVAIIHTLLSIAGIKRYRERDEELQTTYA